MSWLKDLQVFLSGKKTIITAVLYGVDAFGAQMGWWEADTVRTSVEQVLMVVFLRQGVTKAPAVS